MSVQEVKILNARSQCSINMQGMCRLLVGMGWGQQRGESSLKNETFGEGGTFFFRKREEGRGFLLFHRFMFCLLSVQVRTSVNM